MALRAEASGADPTLGGPPVNLPRWSRGTPWRLLVFGFSAVAFMVNVAWTWVPLPWRDESATWLSTDRSLDQLRSMLGFVDGVHGLYYLTLRAWTPLFSDSLFSLRAYSAVGVAVGVALVMLAATRMVGPVAAVAAGVIYAVLPPVTWAASEARSYAWSAAFACAVTLAFWVAMSKDGWRWWAGYAVVLVVAVHWFVYILLVLPAVALCLPWLTRARRWRALVATAVAVLACLPFAYLVSTQSSQVSWLATFPVTAVDVTMGVFWGTVPSAQYIGSALLIACLGVAGYSWARGRDRAALTYLVAWLLIPSIVLVALHPLVQLYHRRYLLMCLPALAILLGVLVDRLRRWWLRTLMVILVVAICVPGYQASREADSKLTPASAADDLAAHAEPGDGLYVVDADVNALGWSFPEQVRGLVNLSQPVDDAWRSHDLFPPSVPVAKLGGRLDAVDRVWIWSLPDGVDDAVSAFAEAGFRKVDRIREKDHYRTVLVLLERKLA